MAAASNADSAAREATASRQTEPMLDNLFRDETTVPLVQERFALAAGADASRRLDDASGRARLLCGGVCVPT
jgi:hypothetical protein